MPLGSLFYTVSISASVLLLILSLLFKVAGKLRLTLPLLYMVAAVISTFFTDWTSKNEQLVLLGLYVLIGLVFISWIVSLVKLSAGDVWREPWKRTSRGRLIAREN